METLITLLIIAAVVCVAIWIIRMIPFPAGLEFLQFILIAIVAILALIKIWPLLA